MAQDEFDLPQDNEPAEPNNAEGASSRLSPLNQLEALLWIAVGAGLLALIASSTSAVAAAVGIGTLIFLAAFAGGAFLGFLFGVPRVLSREPDSNTAPAGASTNTGIVGSGAGSAPPGSTSAKRLLISNTNLERISDWLTTLIVGATLVELHQLNEGLLMFRNYLAETALVFPGPKGPTAGVLPAVGPAILIFGSICGFLFMYLSSRLVLIRMFHAVELLISGGAKLPPSAARTLIAFERQSSPKEGFVARQLRGKRRPTVEDALNLMFDLLYKASPDKVIELGGQLSNTAAINRPEYWFYLAAAFGQKLHQLERGTDEWDSARDNALDCARRAVALDGSYRNRLWAISDPDSSDDDLAPLRNDPEFRKIVGR